MRSKSSKDNKTLRPRCGAVSKHYSNKSFAHDKFEYGTTLIHGSGHRAELAGVVPFGVQ